jgi:hypothetical protein
MSGSLWLDEEGRVVDEEEGTLGEELEEDELLLLVEEEEGTLGEELEEDELLLLVEEEEMLTDELAAFEVDELVGVELKREEAEKEAAFEESEGELLGFLLLTTSGIPTAKPRRITKIAGSKMRMGNLYVLRGATGKLKSE